MTEDVRKHYKLRCTEAKMAGAIKTAAKRTKI